MRIVVSYSSTGRGGDAIQLLSWAKAFRYLGHDVELLGPYPPKPYSFSDLRSQLHDLVRSSPWWFRDLVEMVLSLKVLASFRKANKGADLIFHRVGIYDILGVSLSNAYLCPLIALLDTPFARERKAMGKGYFRRLHKWAMDRVGRKSYLMVAISRIVAGYYADMGLEERKIIYMPNGVSEEHLRKGREISAKAPPFGSDPITIGFVGSLNKIHPLDDLLKAFAMLKDRYRARLMIVGYGEDYKRLLDMSRELGIERDIVWTGPIPHEEAFERIGNFDIATLPELCYPGTPIKLLEYAALGRPIVAPDYPSIRDLFDPDEVYFLPEKGPSSLASAIEELIEDKGRAIAMGRKAQERVKDYTWEGNARKLMALIPIRS